MIGMVFTPYFKQTLILFVILLLFATLWWWMWLKAYFRSRKGDDE